MTAAMKKPTPRSSRAAPQVASRVARLAAACQTLERPICCTPYCTRTMSEVTIETRKAVRVTSTMSSTSDDDWDDEAPRMAAQSTKGAVPQRSRRPTVTTPARKR